MNKKTILWIILDLIFLIVFNTVFFLVGGTEHTTPVWISYGFIHFAYVMVIFAHHFVSEGKSRAVFAFPVYTIAIAYFFIELIVGIVFIFALSNNFKATVAVQVILAGAFLILLIANMIANENTAEAEEKRQQQIDYVKKASAELSAILDLVGSEGGSQETKRIVEQAFDVVRTSPVKSHSNVAQLELQILFAINELKSAIDNGDETEAQAKGNALTTMVSERNRQLKLLN